MYRGYNITKFELDKLFHSIGYSKMAYIDDYFNSQKAKIRIALRVFYIEWMKKGAWMEN